jgi:hypothetical protein
MARYPIRSAGSVPRDARKKAQNIAEMEIAKMIDDYVNPLAAISEFPKPTYPYCEIAEALNVSEDIVYNILFRYDGGSYQMHLEIMEILTSHYIHRSEHRRCNVKGRTFNGNP